MECTVFLRNYVLMNLNSQYCQSYHPGDYYEYHCND
ncbi:hypothetical protein PFFCH_00929 [Plasmodium falciparum FCH/4]|uniref:Uncharacterized protein n=1 Tax=Plasmodium falciparum FCH/4 TaxID=1036724 RepID=A0A024VUU9_PLAFA|nr:hypothetical protein PFFCH_00929 [Plasmodium falciparum FCH/4]